MHVIICVVLADASVGMKDGSLWHRNSDHSVFDRGHKAKTRCLNSMTRLARSLAAGQDTSDVAKEGMWQRGNCQILVSNTHVFALQQSHGRTM